MKYATCVYNFDNFYNGIDIDKAANAPPSFEEAKHKVDDHSYLI